jgi:SAM-dependent methyltransferase
MSAVLEQKVREFGAHSSPGSWFLSSESDVEKYPELLPYSHYLRQAWRKLELSGVLCVDARPTVYLCGGADFTTKQKREHHRFAWNQGLVPLLIFLTANQVEVHSTVKKPEKESQDGHLFDKDLSSLIIRFDNIAETLEAARLIRTIESGQFFQSQASFFPKKESVDRCLVENLVHTTRKLKEANWDLPQAHALLGRALFISFLQERKFIKAHYYPDGTTSLLEILESPTVERQKQLLYREFFPRLKREFNGTMFDEALAKEEREVRKIHLDILRDFLSGHDMESGQMTLDFWAYDFSSIPVETISAIYEEFMKDTDLEKRRSEGAYYTPRHLAETTLHVALEDRYHASAGWRVLDPACGSGIFLVGMFNLLAEQWRRENSNRRQQTKAQELLKILQTQIRGVDVNPDACRITAFSLYLALFEKLRPIDVDEFKERVRYEDFLPPLFLDESSEGPQPNEPIIFCGNFLEDELGLKADFDLVIGNPPWDSRGRKQIALHFAKHSAKFIRDGGIGCLLLPSTILVNRYGTMDGTWFRAVTVERIVQLADFRFVLFKATHPCFIMRFAKQTPSQNRIVAYETPKLSRFESRTGIFVVEPDDSKLIPYHDILEAALTGSLQAIWSRKFWGTPRDEAFLRRLDFFPRLSQSASEMKWGGGVGFQPYYPGASSGDPKPLKPWKLLDRYLPNDNNFPRLIVQDGDLITLKEGLESSVIKRHEQEIPALLDGLHRKPADSVFEPPMVIFSNGFTKFAFCDNKVFFQDSLRSITGSQNDVDLLRFLTAVLRSRLMRYQAFHSGSSNGIGRDKLHLYESLNMPFPLPQHELAPSNANQIVSEAAGVFKALERALKTSATPREDLTKVAAVKLERLVEAYFSVTDAERILIEDTLAISQASIHRSNLEAEIPSLSFPERSDREGYAKTLCQVLNSRARKRGIKVYSEARISKPLKLILLTVVFAEERRPYRELPDEDGFWKALDRVSDAAKRKSGPFSYLRGFSYVERPNRLHLLKPATMRNWCRTAALNDADAIFEHLVTENQ